MPSPFPGMDPYLEDPEHWRGVHHRIIAYAAEALKPVLPAGYYADIDERLYVLPPSRSIYPDVTLLHHGPDRVREHGSSAVAERDDAPLVLTAYPEEITEGYIEVFKKGDPRKLVTVIEVLSPTNKAAGGEARAEYLKKQSEIVRSDVNLLEIDLLRSGTHSVAAPLAVLSERGRWDYLACLHRPASRYTYTCWTIQLRHMLPHLMVPLQAGDEHVILDLQSVFDRAYDAGPYSDVIDYSGDAVPPLEGDDAKWADTLLRGKRLRP